MSDDFSARLALPYLAAGQMQKHVTLNTALTRLDALLQTAVVSRTTAIQPGDAPDGALYILPDDTEGAAWAGRAAGTLIRFEGGGWTIVPTHDGVIAVVLDEGVAVVRADAGWVALGERLGEVQCLARLGLGTTADDANPLAAKINAALFTARGVDEGGDGDLRLTFNKEAAADVLSLLFQSGYAARAELGLIGDDDLGLKACDDVGTWRSVFRVDRTTGRIAFDQGAVRRETVLFTNDGDYVPPPWARWIEVACVGGGGGGGVGGLGLRAANAGGDSSITASATTGGETACADGPGGGGGGGGLSATNVSQSGGPDGAGGWSCLRAAGGVAGAAGQASAKPSVSMAGGGGGGGNASANDAGSAGGAGGTFGAGGGGGGAGLTVAGQGGSGAAGVVRITAVG